MKSLIGKEWRDAKDGKVIEVMNPATGELVDTVPSLSVEEVNEAVDYAEVAEIIQKIKKYDSFLDDEYGENALEMRNKIDEIEDLVQKEENPSRIKALLNDIKNLSIGVAGSLIASGIVTLLSRV